ncbi:HGGxSTG domain-containing protein [Dankookia sp. P2]|uniref:HGGxSTG domain-containing protein n=1 Tax=Dankookia sp. P2 TaxID=3423955 RepID=UPI003D670D69
MRNGRCRMHGGASTGRRTPEGLERLRQAPMKHGRRSAEARQAARERAPPGARWRPSTRAARAR